MTGSPDTGPRLVGVLVTFDRAEALEATLGRLASQTRSLDRLVVVDNDPGARTRAVVARCAPAAEYVAAPANLGPAGGIALGMDRILDGLDDDDWIVTLDDDDPPEDPATLASLLAFAVAVRARDPRVGGVGLAGERFDRRRGRIVRVPDAELAGPVPVDVVAGNNFPAFVVEAVRAVGGFRADLFFGFEELEYGLRLGEAGYSVYADGDAWRERRRRYGRLDQEPVAARTLGEVHWRRYYSLRNLVRILRDHGARTAAIRVTLTVGLGKPVANLVVTPRRACAHLRLNARACLDAWTGRMGRTLEPA